MKKTLYIDLDNTLVDFKSGIERLAPEVRAAFDGHFDDAPGIFALMEPMVGAVHAFNQLAQAFDIYILSTAPWDNPSAWSDKLVWVKRHFGASEESPAYKRLILSHHKNLNRGDLIVDDRDARGVRSFDGEWVQFGSDRFPDWDATLAYLLTRV